MARHVHPAKLAGLLANFTTWRWKRNAGLSFESRVRPYCDSPKAVELTARIPRRDLRKNVFDPEGGGGQCTVVLHVPCRACSKCRVFKTMAWRQRAMREIAKASELGERTWFVTLTLRAKARDEMMAEAIARFGTHEPSYSDKAQIVLGWLQPYMKRLRAVATNDWACRLRFLAVTEAHADGTPHIHLLVHGGIPKAAFRKGKWPYGFVHAMLCDANTANYLCKYIAKEAGRVRASVRYGAREQPRAASIFKSDSSGRSESGNTENLSLREERIDHQTRDAQEKDRSAGDINSGDGLAALAGAVWKGDLEVDDAAVLKAAINALTKPRKTRKQPPGSTGPRLDQPAVEGRERPRPRSGREPVHAAAGEPGEPRQGSRRRKAGPNRGKHQDDKPDGAVELASPAVEADKHPGELADDNGKETSEPR